MYVIKSAFVAIFLPVVAFGENVGWKDYFTENPTEFHDIPLVWANEKTNVPSWLSGTYVRNGPAQISFGSSRRIMTSWLEGFAKLHSFKMRGSEFLYSGAMLQSPNYVASVEAGELVPMTTLNKFDSEEEEWSWWEWFQILIKTFRMDEMGNNNPALWRIGPQEDGIYLAVTDAKVSTRFNISDLSTIGQEYPPSYPLTLNGCAHWMREVGTDNSIYFNYKKGYTGAPWVEVLRYRPESTFQTPEIIASFKPTKFSYIHSFSITENYAVFLFYPVVIDPKKVPKSNFHVFELFDGSNRTDTTDIFVVNLKNGEVKGPFPTPYTFSTHHVNAYEENTNEIILDMCPTPFENMREYLKLENMINPPEKIDETSESSTTGDSEAMRYTINIKTGDVKINTFENIIKSKFINHFDFPTINEDYRGKKYCYTYGMSAFAYSRTALVKKNVCNPKEDKIWYKENHYVGEAHFLPKPGGTSEDDGVLITIVFDGPKKQSYLLLLDAKSLTPINHSYLPHNIPWSAHGMYFPEATMEKMSRNEQKQQKQEL